MPEIEKTKTVAIYSNFYLKKAVLCWVLPLSVVLLWEVVARNGLVPTSIVPPPSKAILAFGKLLFDGSILKNSAISLARLLAGLSLGGFVGIAIGFLVGMRRSASIILEPTLSALIPIPGVAWIPLLIIFFGIGETTKVLLLAIGAFCVLFIQTLHGVRGVDKHLVEVGRVFRKGRWAILLHILLPGSLPSIFSGLKIALALSWTLLVASEMIASSSGLGWLIWNSRNFSRADEMIAGMIAVAILGKVTEIALNVAQKHALRWRSTFHDLDA